MSEIRQVGCYARGVCGVNRTTRRWRTRGFFRFLTWANESAGELLYGDSDAPFLATGSASSFRDRFAAHPSRPVLLIFLAGAWPISLTLGSHGYLSHSPKNAASRDKSQDICRLAPSMGPSRRRAVAGGRRRAFQPVIRKEGERQLNRFMRLLATPEEPYTGWRCPPGPFG